MKIDQTMSVYAVLERMGAEATQAEAETMVEFLLAGDYADTNEIPESEWLELVGMAVQGVARNVELAISRSAIATK